MNLQRVLWVSLLACASSGCVTQSAAWISASRFDYRLYEHGKVAVMPVQIYKMIDPESFPSKIMQDVIADQLGVLRIPHPTVIAPGDAGDVAFPYTPKQMIAFGAAKGYDAVVAATVVRMDPRTSRQHWSFTGNITFVDVKNPERRWTVAKTWDLVGEPRGYTARNQIGSALQSDFIQVRRILPRGVINKWLLWRSTVVVDRGPVLNLDIVNSLVDAKSNVTQFVADDPGRTVGTKHVMVDVSAIDDEGIESLQIVNRNAADGSNVWGNLPLKKTEASVEQKANLPSSPSSQPKFLAERVAIKILPGTNLIEAFAVNGRGEKSHGNIRLKLEVAKDAPVEMVVVAANKFNTPQNADLRLSDAAAARLKVLVDSDGATLAKGGHAITYVEDNATRDKVLGGITRDWKGAGGGTRRVIAFLGRAEMYGGRPYLMLRDAEVDYPEIGSVSVNDFVALMGLGISRASLDVCTNYSQPEEIKAAIAEYITVRIDVEVVADCGNPIGKAFLKIDKDELQDD